jgi:hypothetical protein
VRNYPLLDLFWTILYLFVWIIWIFLLMRIIGDIFRSPDLSGWARGGWVVLLVVLPFFGALAYIIFRGAGMHTRENRQQLVNEDALQRYFQHLGNGGHGHSTADELSKLAALRDQGVLTGDEFAAQKAKILA